MKHFTHLQVAQLQAIVATFETLLADARHALKLATDERANAQKGERGPNRPKESPPCDEGCPFCTGEGCMQHGGAPCDCDTAERHEFGPSPFSENP